MPPRAVRLRKRELATRLQQVNSHPEPKVVLEQYTIPADLAAEILFQACYVHGDIDGKFVIDLGTGTGRLALGASLLGAGYAVGVDLDLPSLRLASKNAKQIGLSLDWLLADIGTLRGQVDTVLMNPPFGTKQPHADLNFLETASRLGKVVYSIHKSSTREYLVRWLKQRTGKPERIISTKMEIPHQFSFHRKRKRYVDVDVFRIQTRSPALI